MKNFTLLLSIFLLAQIQFVNAQDTIWANTNTELGTAGATDAPYQGGDGEIGGIDNGDWVKFSNVDFTKADYNSIMILVVLAMQDTNQPILMYELTLKRDN
ncbi:MAG: hypothetical protein HC896_01535 [Bacteroidales bacterium]|nr:hypothetical protein [Bacteroidales bacterium]